MWVLMERLKGGGGTELFGYLEYSLSHIDNNDRFNFLLKDVGPT